MDQIWKLDRILNKEHGNVVTNQIPVAFVGVKLDSEAADIPRGIFRTTLTSYGRKADKYRCDFSRLLKWRRPGVLGQRCITFKEAMRS